MDMIEKCINDFIEELKKKSDYKLIRMSDESSDNYQYNIYNEISLQHELGSYLRNKLGNYKIFFEKNMYDSNKDEFVKKEADIVIVNENETEKYAIELKFSKGKNSRVPENMYDFIKDIRFMEQVCEKKKYNNAYNLIIVDSRKYFDYSLNNEDNLKKRYNIYKIFRRKGEKVVIEKQLDNEIINSNEINNNKYCRPTGRDKGKEFKLCREKGYECEWKKIFEEDKGEKSEKNKCEYRYLLFKQNEN